MYGLLIAGTLLVGAILALFWFKDHLRNPTLARLAHSEPIARLALTGAAFFILGVLLIAAELFGG